MRENDLKRNTIEIIKPFVNNNKIQRAIRLPLNSIKYTGANSISVLFSTQNKSFFLAEGNKQESIHYH